jgi:hypothetical protein
MGNIAHMATANFEVQIRQTIEAFVEQLSALVRNAAVQSVTDAFGASGASVSRRGRPAAAVTAPRTAGRRAKGQKRAPADLEQITGQLLSAIKSSPGQRMEQIAQALQTTTKDLALPAKKLIAAKKIKTKGERRATKYFPA